MPDHTRIRVFKQSHISDIVNFFIILYIIISNVNAIFDTIFGAKVAKY